MGADVVFVARHCKMFRKDLAGLSSFRMLQQDGRQLAKSA
jgi:hypothetical protein